MNIFKRLRAIEDYTATIETADISPDIVAISLFNRAVLYVASGDEVQAMADLDALLTANSSQVSIRTMSRNLLARIAARKRTEGHLG